MKNRELETNFELDKFMENSKALNYQTDLHEEKNGNAIQLAFYWRKLSSVHFQTNWILANGILSNFMRNIKEKYSI